MVYEDILTALREKAQEYVPEWKWEEATPDLGMAFALTFARLYEETAERYKHLHEFHREAFLDCLKLASLPEIPAAGFVCFHLAQSAPKGEAVEQGTELYDSSEGSYRTTQDIFCTAAQAVCVYGTNSRKDRIEQFWDGRMPFRFSLFDDSNPSFQEHDWYLCHKQAFFTQHGKQEVLLMLNPRELERLQTSDVVWEYYNDGFHPFSQVQWQEDRVCLSWEEKRKFQKVPLFDQETFMIRCRAGKAGTLQITRVLIGYERDRITPQHLYHRDEELLKEEGRYYPFGKQLVPDDDFYIACFPVLEKKGAEITLSFQIRGEVAVSKMITGGVIADGQVLAADEANADSIIPAANINRISLEYWNGSGFVTLPAEGGAAKLFSGLDREWNKRSVTFRAPADGTVMNLNGVDSMWLRIRIREIEHFSYLQGPAQVPVLKDVNFSCSFGKEGVKPDGHILRNNMETTILGSDCEAFPPFAPMKPEETAIYFGFDKPFGGFPVSLYAELTGPEQMMMPELEYQIYTSQGFVDIAVADDTCSFRRSGMLVLFPDQEQAAVRLFGETRYWLRAVYAPGEEPVSVQFSRLYENAVPISQFQAGTDGRSGCGAGEIIRMAVAGGYIQKVTNPAIITGGRSAETREQVRRRTVEVFHHRQRGVTARDMEVLAGEATPLFRSKCLEKPGALTLVYLPADYNAGQRMGGSLDRQIRQYLQERSHPMFRQKDRLSVREAACLFVSIRVEAAFTPEYGNVKGKRELQEGLKAFLNPVTGNFARRGFAIGEFPDRELILNFLYSCTYVERVRRLHIVISEGSREHGIPVSGNHQIHILTER